MRKQPQAGELVFVRARFMQVGRDVPNTAAWMHGQYVLQAIDAHGQDMPGMSAIWAEPEVVVTAAEVRDIVKGRKP